MAGGVRDDCGGEFSTGKVGITNDPDPSFDVLHNTAAVTLDSLLWIIVQLRESLGNDELLRQYCRRGVE